MPGIATQIYQEFDAALNAKPIREPFRLRLLSDTEYLSQRGVTPPAKPKEDPAHKLSRFIIDYLAHLETNQVGSNKERATRKTRCGEFLQCVGDIRIQDIKKVHAYQYAGWLAQKGLANKTIVSAVSRVSVLLIHAEKQGIIESNPFTSLSLDEYGKKAESYLPFDPAEMKAIFAQDMPYQDRLALTLLATTGARLDEIALLEWSQVQEESGITFLDLRSAEKIKNEQSRRVIAVHSKVAPMLARRGTGRIFDYPVDYDGKAQNAAGKRLSKWVDRITNHPLKVLHSFRHTLKDMLRDAGVSTELNNRITGHAMPDVAGKYGLGHALIPRSEAIEKLPLEFLPD